MGGEEAPGATRILQIVREGTPVKAGDVVVRLDSSAFEDEEQAQQIRFLQAKAFVQQAQSILEVYEISLREYREGIFPQDKQLIKDYIATSELDKDRLERTVKWSRDMQKKGYRTRNQVNGDEKSYDQAAIALEEAKGMLSRLEGQTGPKNILALEANVKAVQADKLMQDRAFELEKQRLERIQKNIRNCTVRAPRDGVVVYANQVDNWGQVLAPVDEGVTLYQNQPIFNLPDPLHMRVKAQINESKLACIRRGQPALIVIDAFRGRTLRGTVAEINAINIPLRGSDVRVYYANVNIEESFEALKPGLSAEVTFRVQSRQAVTRVRLDSVRWAGGQTFVALYDSAAADAGKPPWRWQQVELGLSDATFAEVVNGLKPGDRVASPSTGLDNPTPEHPTSVARLTAN
jgi:HlyD family secretion protein